MTPFIIVLMMYDNVRTPKISYKQTTRCCCVRDESGFSLVEK